MPDGAGGDEAVHGDLLDLRLQSVDLLLQSSVLGGQLGGAVVELLELGLGLEVRGRRGVGPVAGRSDLPCGLLGGIVVGVGAAPSRLHRWTPTPRSAPARTEQSSGRGSRAARLPGVAVR